jgi:hypothetical protein
MNINEVFKSPFTDVSSLSGLVTTFVNIAFVVAGVILLFFFIFGGIGMITNAGSDNAQQMEQSKKTVTSAIIGFIVVFASYWIVKLVEQITGAQTFFR